MEILGNDKHKIIRGDVFDALKEIPDNSVDLIFADPPYNIGKNFNGHKDNFAIYQNFTNLGFVI